MGLPDLRSPNVPRGPQLAETSEDVIEFLGAKRCSGWKLRCRRRCQTPHLSLL